MSSGVYRIQNIIEDKNYIGKSWNIEKRWKQHIATLKSNKHINSKLQSAFNKYGLDSFEFTILEETDKPELMDYFESYYTEKYNAINDGYSIEKLHSSQDIKFVIDNMDRLGSKWIKILEMMNNKINKEFWGYDTNLSRVSNKLGITIEQTAIFLKYFKVEGFTFNPNFNEVNIRYMSQNYIDSKMEDFYL